MPYPSWANREAKEVGQPTTGRVGNILVADTSVWRLNMFQNDSVMEMCSNFKFQIEDTAF